MLRATRLRFASGVLLLAVVLPGCGGGGSGGGGGFAGTPLGSDSDIVYIKASNTAADDRFGGSLQQPLAAEDNFGGDTVALSADGDTLVVGAPTHPMAAGAGRVYVFVRDGGGDWSEQATFQGTNTGATDRFGASVALSANGDTLAVGSPLDDGTALNAGAVYVFTRSDSSWGEEEYIEASVPAAGDVFGTSVALSEDGNILAVGAIGKDGGASQEGAAYLFTRGGSTWTERDTVVSTTPENNDLLGYRVALSANGRTLAVGAVQDGASDRPTGAGAVHVFTDGNADDDWDFLQEVHAPSPEKGAKFGASVALSDSGDRLAAGAHAEDGRGEVHVFLVSGGTYGLEQSLVASNADSGDRFGASVALSAAGDLLVVGATFEDSSATGIDGNAGNDSATDAGATYLFSRSGTSWSQMNYIKATNTDANDFFGESVALSDDAEELAIGAGGEASNATGINGNQDNDSTNNAGAVYLY
ncbi:MAG: hypothetical protein U5K33_06850 [Halofilum sp. (in: g-proteobacteria)]|nr:hypothetical protein [Halofilum sp. (in: g-proteobacteria)]